MSALPARSRFDPAATTRPDPALLRYYALVALCSGPLFVVAFPPLYVRYATLRYRFDEEGVAMSWGYLFRKEVYLTYRRIQDIHITRSLLQRWMNLATVAVQTASGSAGPEMSIEGILDVDGLRDFLYTRMRGARGHADIAPPEQHPAAAAHAADPDTEALALLRDIRDALREMAANRGNAP